MLTGTLKGYRFKPCLAHPTSSSKVRRSSPIVQKKFLRTGVVSTTIMPPQGKQRQDQEFRVLLPYRVGDILGSMSPYFKKPKAEKLLEP